jgi:hypothetical protein
MISNLRLRNAPLNHPALLGQIVFALPVIHVSLRVLGFKRTLSLLKKFPHGATADNSDNAQQTSQAIIIGQMVNAVATRFTMSCLDRSVLLWWLLRQKGAPAALVLGAPLEKRAQFVAHAWVECDETIVNDTPQIHSHYAVLTSYDNL